MQRASVAGVWVALAALAACIDFDAAYRDCYDGGACKDAGGVGGGAAAGGGGADDAGLDAGSDAGSDAGADAGVDAGVDGGIDAGADAGSDAGVDGGNDAGFDAGFDPTQRNSCKGQNYLCSDAGESCCDSVLVPGGSYLRSYEAVDGGNYRDAGHPATVSNFELDRFEVTVNRFRLFLNSYSVGWRPDAGAGRNVHDPNDTGWRPAWDGYLPASATAIVTAFPSCGPYTYADPGPTNDTLPINCVSWYLAYAFCIWDSDRLPTEAEWNYAAAGGDEQRPYPWLPATSLVLDAGLAVFQCLGDGAQGCSGVPDILPVGSRRQGDGRWGHSDLAGSMNEWTLDRFAPYDHPCSDCAHTDAGPADLRVMRGGGYASGSGSAAQLLNLRTAERRTVDAGVITFDDVGFRCARNR